MPRFDLAHWDVYNSHQGDRPVRASCRRVLELVGPGAGRRALDVGAGAGIETAALLAAGWRVVALDPAPAAAAAIARAARRALGSDALDPDRLQVLTTTLQDAPELAPLDLVHAAYALPFVAPDAFDATWARLRSAVAAGGWIAATFFGDRDDWAADPALACRLSFHDAAALDELLAGLDVVDRVEDERDGPSFGGPKHWHVVEVVARTAC